jgi:hypothetical protein
MESIPDPTVGELRTLASRVLGADPGLWYLGSASGSVSNDARLRRGPASSPDSSSQAGIRRRRIQMGMVRTMNDCIFCRIIDGVAPAFKFYEDDDYVGILPREFCADYQSASRLMSFTPLSL